MDQAVHNGDLKRVQELIRNGVDVNGSYGDSPLLHLAIKKDHGNIALALLAAGADVYTRKVHTGGQLFVGLVWWGKKTSYKRSLTKAVE